MKTKRKPGRPKDTAKANSMRGVVIVRLHADEAKALRLEAIARSDEDHIVTVSEVLRSLIREWLKS